MTMLRFAVGVGVLAVAAGAPTREPFGWRKTMRPVMMAEPDIVEPEELAPTPSNDPCADKSKPCKLTTDMDPEQVEEARAYYVEKHQGMDEDPAADADADADAKDGSDEDGYGDEEADVMLPPLLTAAKVKMGMRMKRDLKALKSDSQLSSAVRTKRKIRGGAFTVAKDDQDGRKMTTTTPRRRVRQL